MKTTHSILAALLVLVGGSLAALPPQKVQELQAKGITNWTPGQFRGVHPVMKPLPQPVAAPLGRDTQTMTYDNGSLTALPTTFGNVYGNRFRFGVGGVELNAATLNSFEFYFMEDSLPDTGLFFQIGGLSGTMSINAAASTNFTGLMNSGPNFSAPVLNVVDASGFAGAGTMFNDTLFLGGWCLNSASMFPVNNEVLGLATNGPRQEGYTAASGTGAVAFTPQAFNAIIRANVTSASLVPVELMSFGIE